ncbi:uncharacterized protein [Macrobrachium rosenbergii]|uniref:uncharacterized protein n=1 Tax=Macrobrachium rosenbergii TaxID=79674 RepID=UPI0034D5842F
MAESFVKKFDAAQSLVDGSSSTRARPSHYVYIELDDEVTSQLRVLQEALSDEAIKYDLEEIDILHAHITLGVFDLRPCMREYSEEQLDCLKSELLLEVMENRPSFQAKFLGLGHFGGKFLYVEIERSQDLLDLRSKVVDTFEKHGIPCTDKRPYAPHITLFKGSMRTKADEETKLSLREYVSSIELPDMKNVWVDAIHIREIRGR